MKNTIIKKIRVSVLIALVLCIMISAVSFEAKCDDLRNNVLRLHILANSDSDADQELKLKVRDAILENSAIQFEECCNLADALKVAENSTAELSLIAQKVIKENGYNYEVKVEVGKSYFDTREYENFTLPAGFYNSVIIKIGKAEGKNWWCVMFPALCVPSANASLNESVGEDSAKIATNASNYKIAFKSVEIYEKFKKIVLNK